MALLSSSLVVVLALALAGLAVGAAALAVLRVRRRRFGPLPGHRRRLAGLVHATRHVTLRPPTTSSDHEHARALAAGLGCLVARDLATVRGWMLHEADGASTPPGGLDLQLVLGRTSDDWHLALTLTGPGVQAVGIATGDEMDLLRDLRRAEQALVRAIHGDGAPPADAIGTHWPGALDTVLRVGALVLEPTSPARRAALREALARSEEMSCTVARLALARALRDEQPGLSAQLLDEAASLDPAWPTPAWMRLQMSADGRVTLAEGSRQQALEAFLASFPWHTGANLMLADTLEAGDPRWHEEARTLRALLPPRSDEVVSRGDEARP